VGNGRAGTGGFGSSLESTSERARRLGELGAARAPCTGLRQLVIAPVSAAPLGEESVAVWSAGGGCRMARWRPPAWAVFAGKCRYRTVEVGSHFQIVDSGGAPRQDCAGLMGGGAVLELQPGTLP